MIQLDPKLPWTETLVVSYQEVHTVDHEDDLNRELALYALTIFVEPDSYSPSAAATNRPFTAPKKPVPLLRNLNSHLHALRTTLPKWSSPIRTWNVSVSVY